MTTTDTDRAWSDGDHRDRRVWTGPVAAALGLVLAVLAVFAIVTTLTGSGDDSTNAAPATPPAAPTAAGDSICGLTGGQPGQPVTTAPAATWLYSGSGTTAYPTSPTNGPGATSEAGYRYCFPHTTEGALFAAANAVAIPSDDESETAWADYWISNGPYRDSLLTLAQPSTDQATIRIQIVGFRILDATGDTAKVDLAVQMNGQGHSVYGAGVYDLVWQNGDWRANADTDQPLVFTSIPNTAGYIAWGP